MLKLEDKMVKLSYYGFSILQIEPFLMCNMNCEFCAYPLIKDKGVKLSTPEVLGLVDSINPEDEGFEYICFNQYNEPLLDKRIFEFIKYAKDKGFKVLIITNGLSFRSEKIREKLIEAEPTYIKISVQTLNKDTFLGSRGIDYSFDDYKKAIFKFLESSLESGSSSKITIDIACNFLSTKSLMLRTLLGIEHGDPSVPNTLREIEEDLIDFLKELHGYGSSFNYNEVEVKRYLKTLERQYLGQEELPIAKNISVKIKQFIYGRRLSEFYPSFKTVRCGTRILSVLANGSIVPCCLAYNDMLSMGNIKRESLKHILDKNIDYINRIKKGNYMPGVCRRCEGAPTKRGALALSTLRLLRSLK
jgi:radical SAM protein with 4Fe4S-binding SPASM domain